MEKAYTFMIPHLPVKHCTCIHQGTVVSVVSNVYEVLHVVFTITNYSFMYCIVLKIAFKICIKLNRINE